MPDLVKIEVSEETYNEVEGRRKEWGLKTHDEVVARLLDLAEKQKAEKGKEWAERFRHHMGEEEEEGGEADE